MRKALQRGIADGGASFTCTRYKTDYCIIGEPSSAAVGDVVRCGRRGSLNGTLTVNGIQGHVAYNDARNPIHEATAALAGFAQSNGTTAMNTAYQPAVLNINSGMARPMSFRTEALFNIASIPNRPAPDCNEPSPNYSTVVALTHHDRHLSGEPFLTERVMLTDAVSAAILAETGQTELSSGGTSDGRFISPWCQPGSNQVEVVEFGLTNATIHKIDECVDLMSRAAGRIYQQTIETLLANEAVYLVGCCRLTFAVMFAASIVVRLVDNTMAYAELTSARAPGGQLHVIDRATPSRPADVGLRPASLLRLQPLTTGRLATLKSGWPASPVLTLRASNYTQAAIQRRRHQPMAHAIRHRFAWYFRISAHDHET